MIEVASILNDRSRVIGPGRLVLVVGPSGAGKDTLIGLARDALADEADVVFARRLVTREASAFEDNEQVDGETFRREASAGRYAVHWNAHGHCYALPGTINDHIRAGRTVVANVSRTVVAALRDAYASVVVVEISAPAEVLAARVAMRRRDSDGKIENRLQRTVDGKVTADATIVNVGSAEFHARHLARIIAGG
ncbi:phosphonate metabolism protein/1,5-bisphosphokinase (PRPP-forming) PhnN [Afipia sp. TerB]